MPTPAHGQVTLSGSAQQLDPTLAGAKCAGYSIKAPLTNAHVAYVGASGVTTSTGYPMYPGDEISYERLVQNGQPRYQLKPSDFYAVGTSGDVISWLALQ